MATPNSQQKQKNRAIPPKRGQIKAQIFESFIETVSSIFPPKILLGEIDFGGGGVVDDSDGRSTAATSVASASPPPTA
ncbi:hypothetical protein RND71_009856 [Anisodus tanguticus]|uniref:Uncharacterized protein n=1 Tax=Anisodus tanguticus TaxID=243964 RepID=A0AAE1SIM2_9SOLA|nr:hypothetical protein RND71_009856 [Anisodus tanguticus]